MRNEAIHLVTPTRAAIFTSTPKENVEKFLTYVDKRVDFHLAKVKKSVKRLRSIPGIQDNPDLAARLASQEALQAELMATRSKTLVTSQTSHLEAPSGLSERLAKKYGLREVREYEIPEPRGPLPVHGALHPDRDYQVRAHDLLLRAAAYGPAGVELATGGGKTTVIRNLVRTLGLGTTIMAPSQSIARQIFDELCRVFGAKYVGLYGDGKKDFKKLITVGIDDSLTRIKPGSPAWVKLSKNPVFIADESHLCPSDTLAAVCYGLAANAPYRFFFSGTQMRNDGLDLVLEGIVGRIVMRKNVRELVDEGYLARPNFRVVRVRSNSNVRSADANVMTRAHLYYNPNVCRAAAKLANNFVELMRRPTVILVKEVGQFAKLAPYLKGRVGFAHGPLNPENVEQVPEEHRDSEPGELVAKFNAGELDVLVGTSCIATGTDIQVAEAGIYLVGGTSEIAIRQGVGRETRGGPRSKVVNPWTGKQKLDFVHVDFDVVDPLLSPEELENFAPHRHALKRIEVYADIFSAPEIVNMVQI